MKTTIAPFALLRVVRRLALLMAAVVTIGAAIMPAGAVEPPLGSRNFTPPAYAPDYFSNESGPFHTVPSAPRYGYAAPRYAVPRYTVPVASQPQYAAPMRYATPVAPHYAAYPVYRHRTRYPSAPGYRAPMTAQTVAESSRVRQVHREYRREPARYAARVAPRWGYIHLARADRSPVRRAARVQTAVERRVVMREPRASSRRIEHRSAALRRYSTGRAGGRAVRGRL